MRNSRVALITALLFVGGCGLINALDKLKSITFQLPSHTFAVSTMDPRWRQPPAGGIPPLPCGPGNLIADCCASPVDCNSTPLVCETDKCALKFVYEDVQKVDLANDVPSLGQYKGKVFTQVLLKQLDLDVNSTLNVSTPPVNIYVAPVNVTSSAGAQLIASIPTQAPGAQGHVSVPLSDAAQQVFSNFATDFQTPFNLIFSTTIVVKSGDPIPMGQIQFTVSGTVEAKL